MKKRLKVITASLLMIVMAASGTCVFAGTDVQPAGDEPQAALDVVGEGEAVDEALQRRLRPRRPARPGRCRRRNCREKKQSRKKCCRKRQQPLKKNLRVQKSNRNQLPA